MTRTHGLSRTPEYESYKSMRHRCLDEKHPHWEDYGGRGISICRRWLESFVWFLVDMGPKPSSEYTLEREDPNGNYEPGNCKWATYEEQAANRRDSKLITHNGETHPLRCWARLMNTSHGTLMFRIKRGWSITKTLTIPVGGRNERYQHIDM